MSKRRLQISALDDVFRKTVGALDSGRNQMADILAGAQAERTRLEQAVAEARARVEFCIEEVDGLETTYARARRHVATLINDLVNTDQAMLGAAYAAAEDVLVKLSVARERERAARAQRDALELSLRSTIELVAKAEGMIERIDAVVAYLRGNAERVATEMEDIRMRFEVGERIIQAQEEERRRVAREIHDGPAQAMANVVLRTEICERLLRGNRPEVNQELAQLKDLVKESLREVRTIIFNLRPMALDDLGLVPTLRRYLSNLAGEEPFELHFEVDGDEVRMPSVIEVAAFRMVQEGVNNVRKHARAAHVWVRLKLTPEAVDIAIEDDGVGFDAERTDPVSGKRESFGLMSMRERVQLLDGEFQVHSQPGNGTRIRAAIPVRVPLEEGGAA